MKALLNKKLNGIELLFDEKPEDETRTAIKENGFRWNPKTKVWYVKNTEESKNFVENFFNVSILEEKKEKKQVKSLWERLKVENIQEHEKHTNTKTIAAETRKHFKELFPELKISCRCGSGGWSRYNEVIFELIQAPWEEDSEVNEHFYKYVKSWLWSYNYDNSDSMSDYFDRGFYESIRTKKYNYINPSEEQKKDIEHFLICLDLKKKADEEAEKIRFEEYCKQQEIERKKAAKQEEARKKQESEKRDIINKNIKIVDIEEDKKYIITADFITGIGKESSIGEILTDECKKTVEESAIIAKELYFTEESAYNAFSSMFLYDFDFITGGGTGTIDSRVNAENFSKLNDIQRNSVKWFMFDCIAVFYKNELKYIIDPEGYKYSRYVYIVESKYTTVQLQKAEEEEKEKEKGNFFFPDDIEEQAKNINNNNDYTIISIDPWTITTSMKHVNIKNHYIDKYAQYEKSLFIEYIEKGKRKKIKEHYCNSEKLLIYSGHIEQVPCSMLYTDVSDTLQKANFCGESAHDFILSVKKYYRKKGIEPVIDTLQYK